jgi:hypothetical protein
VADPFLAADGEPRFVRCAVLYVDILGVEAMTTGPDAAAHLIALDRAISGTYRDFLAPESPWRAAAFSDTLVVAAPCEEFGGDEYALGGLIYQAAILQFNLASEGFFARGGISVGDFHIRERLIFGPALVSAYGLEQQAVSPRVILDEPVYALKRRYIEAASEGALPPAPIVRDGDGRVLVDYLGLQFDEPDAERSFALHRDIVTAKLDEHRSSKRVWEKYRWVSEYHNATLELASEDFKRSVDVAGLRIAQGSQTWGFEPFSDRM